MGMIIIVLIYSPFFLISFHRESHLNQCSAALLVIGGILHMDIQFLPYIECEEYILGKG